MAGSSDNRIALDTDNMRDIDSGYTVSCSNAIQIEVRFNVVRVSIAIPKINSSAWGGLQPALYPFGRSAPV